MMMMLIIMIQMQLLSHLEDDNNHYHWKVPVVLNNSWVVIPTGIEPLHHPVVLTRI